MKPIEIYDPALCCSTGVCGPAPDKALASFASVVETLKAKGVEIRRFNLSQEPMTFANQPAVKSVLETEGESGLPLILIDGEIYFRGVYPTLEQLEKIASAKAQSAPISYVKIESPANKNTGSCDSSTGCC